MAAWDADGGPRMEEEECGIVGLIGMEDGSQVDLEEC